MIRKCSGTDSDPVAAGRSIEQVPGRCYASAEYFPIGWRTHISHWHVVPNYEVIRPVERNAAWLLDARRSRYCYAQRVQNVSG